MSAAVIRPATNADGAAVRALIFAVLNEYDLEPAPKTTDKDLDDLEAFYAQGAFDVLETPDGEIIGTVGLARMNGATCELRKMYLKSAHRGRGYGKRLLKHAISKAGELGFQRIELQTARVLEEAIGLYEKFGFKPSDEAALERRCDQALALDL
ncbi:GNAT family N-acetyltransferase [Hyphococcus flavus]|uniref:GNAT family N-acetyltransferase n=1 Tax=Hyphococcus flavus TaxID=1866326 RepID=A0AAF0CH13_9PROT|nr:GNAT family N-acetyltransferase [Hyphococcus flavus]WDI31377.1 GNAT family N-acetyltransferase [Hyphococcus flavus]